MSRLLTIAIDFDGTLVENQYPGIGKPMLFAFETLKRLEEEGHQLILWTYRTGERLEEAVDFCKAQGITFYAINKSYPEEEYEPGGPRKILADLFIDDRNINGLPPWGEIYHQLSSSRPQTPKARVKKKGLLNFLKRK